MRRPSKELTLSVAWAWVYVALVATPLLLVAAAPGGRGFGGELGAALGFLALSVFAGQFVMTARFKWLEPPLGTDLVYAFHRHVTAVGILFALGHAILSSGGVSFALALADPRTGPSGFAGALALALVLAVTATTLWRRRVRLEYDRWRRLHGALALGAVLLAVDHALALGTALGDGPGRALWIVWTAAWIALLFRVRLVKPLVLLRRPWVVAEVLPLGPSAIGLRVLPRGHAGFRFRAGQFAWISVGDSPLRGREHPFSFSGSASDAPLLEFTIKEAGDWTRRVQGLRAGETVYVDGPFGTLSPERYPRAPGFGFVAGGAGIAPILSALRTLADRGDRRPMVLVDANDREDEILWRAELGALAGRLDVDVHHVLVEPPPGWSGESGLLADALLARVGAPRRSWEWFVCGPPPMMDVVERGLHRAGVTRGRIHSERFDLA
jgi:predicted ferric reductase